MSRSYKHNPYVTDNGSRHKFMKKYANKIIRNKLKNSDECMQGSSYRKHSESYKICDYSYYWSSEDAKRVYEQRKNEPYFLYHFPTLESWMRYYDKEVFRK